MREEMKPGQTFTIRPTAVHLFGKTELATVECGGCGWVGKRKPGKLVQCPKCSAFAAYQ